MAKILSLRQPVTKVTQEMVDAFGADPGAFLPEARAHGGDMWRVALHGGGLTREVDVKVGPVWVWGETRWRSLSWDPLPHHGDVVHVDKVLPHFVGEIGLQQEPPQLLLSGTYDPPLGKLGALVDASLLGLVARHTGERLLEDLAERLGASVVA